MPPIPSSYFRLCGSFDWNEMFFLAFRNLRYASAVGWLFGVLLLFKMGRCTGFYQASGLAF